VLLWFYYVLLLQTHAAVIEGALNALLCALVLVVTANSVAAVDGS
jgi:hypothetical protein